MLAHLFEKVVTVVATARWEGIHDSGILLLCDEFEVYTVHVAVNGHCVCRVV